MVSLRPLGEEGSTNCDDFFDTSSNSLVARRWGGTGGTVLNREFSLHDSMLVTVTIVASVKHTHIQLIPTRKRDKHNSGQFAPCTSLIWNSVVLHDPARMLFRSPVDIKSSSIMLTKCTLSF